MPTNASAPRVALLEFRQSFRTTIHLEEVESRESDSAFACSRENESVEREETTKASTHTRLALRVQSEGPLRDNLLV